jgi:hypothetical protein
MASGPDYTPGDVAPVRIAFLSYGMKEDFSWDHQAERYLAIYCELLIN